MCTMILDDEHPIFNLYYHDAFHKNYKKVYAQAIWEAAPLQSGPGR